MSEWKAPMPSLIERCRKAPGRIALPEADDPRTLRAAKLLASLKVVREINLFGDPRQIEEIFATQNISAQDFENVDLKIHNNGDIKLKESCKNFLNTIFQNKKKNIAEEKLNDLSSDPLYQAAHYAALGKCDAVVAGAAHATSDVIRAALTAIGTAEGIKTISGSFVMGRERPEADPEVYLYADCGVVIDPSVEQLVDIAYASVQTWRSLLSDFGDPKLAFLSFSTKNSATHPHQQKVAEAAALFKERHPDIISEGELQFDAAYDANISKSKAPESSLAGDANIFIFPDLDAGNIAYKITQRLAGFNAFGPVLQGLKKPYNDLSRGASDFDIAGAAIISILQSRLS